jgi:hypothetical protein
VCPASPELFGQFCQSAEEWRDGIKEFSAFLRKAEWSPVEQHDAQVILELQNLRADRRLPDAIGHVPRRCADAAVSSNVVKQFEMMDVHAEGGFTQSSGGDSDKHHFPSFPER